MTLAEIHVTLKIPHLKTQHYIVLIQMTKQKCFFLSELLQLEQTQEKWRHTLKHIHINSHLYYCILAHSQMSIRVPIHTLLHTRAHTHLVIFCSIRAQMSIIRTKKQK